MGPRCSVWPFLRIVYTETIVGMCAANILVNFFLHISAVSGYITDSITSSHKQEKRAGTWRLVGMLGTKPSALLDRH